MFQDKYFFQCEENCGLFVSLNKLAPQPPQGSDRGQSQTSQPRSYADTARVQQQDKLGSCVDAPNPQDPPITLYDRVIVYSTKSIAIHGTVRWIGNRSNTRNLCATYVGIETVSNNCNHN